MTLLFSIILSAFISTIAYAQTQDVGVILPLSGDLAVFGEKLRQGIELATEEYKPNINLIYEDAEISNTKAISAYNKIVSTSKISLTFFTCFLHFLHIK